MAEEQLRRAVRKIVERAEVPDHRLSQRLVDSLVSSKGPSARHPWWMDAAAVALGLLVVVTLVVVFRLARPHGPAATPTGGANPWVQVQPNLSPSGRSGAALAYDEATQKLVLFGGRGGTGLIADTWTWNGQSWEELHPAASPPARDGAAIAHDPVTGHLILFGGRGASGALHDTWSWDGSTWSEEHPTNSPPSGPASMVFDPATNGILLLSDVGASSVDRVQACTTTSWSWTGQSWVKRNPPTSPPTSTVYSAMVFDPVSNKVVVYKNHPSPSGCVPVLQALGVPLASTWTWDGRTWTLQHPRINPGEEALAVAASGLSHGPVVLFNGADGATWKWNGQNWSEVARNGITPRAGASIAHDSARRQFVLFGGAPFFPGTPFGDTWVWRAPES